MAKSKAGIFGGKKVNVKAFDNIGKASIKKQIEILPELRDLIPPLSADEFQQLKDNIQREGVQDALHVWANKDKFILVDGHNRHRIIQELNIPDHKWTFLEKDFKSIEEVKEWMILNQLGRRNLDPKNASYLRGSLYEGSKKVVGAPAGNENAKQMVQTAPIESKSTAQLIADKTNVSADTIKRDAQFAKGIDAIGEKDPEAKRQILSGDLKVKKSDIQDIAKGKKTPETILSDLNPSEISDSAEQQTPEESTLNRFKIDISDKDLTDKQLNKVNYATEKFSFHARQMMKVGFSKKEVRAILGAVIKELVV